MPTTTVGKTIKCDLHGPSRWQGDFFCSACGLVYLQPEHGLGPMPDFCACKARLLPPGPHEAGEWSARPACRQCALAQVPGGGEGPPPAA